MIDPTFDYCLSHTSSPGPLLEELERATHLRTMYPQMLSGPYQGMLLQFISRMVQPRRVLEAGAFTGYSAICLAQGLSPDGLLHTIEANEELKPMLLSYLDKAGLSERVKVHFGDVAAIIPALDETFDLVFLDAGKMDYRRHYELALAKTRAGGFLLADNVLWSGKVAGSDPDATAQVLREFNDFVQADARVQNILLPVRDGLLLMRKC